MKNRIKCVCGQMHIENSKTLEYHKKRLSKVEEKVPEKNKNSLTIKPEFDENLKFVSITGNVVLLKDAVDPKDTWMLEKKKEKKAIRILSNLAVRKIAKVAGIRTQYAVKESEHIIPKPENSMLHIVEVTIECMAGIKEGGCFHDPFDRKLTMTGEASKLNTGRGKDYLRSMAEKRGYDRAVLRHLDLDGVYSEEEAIAFEDEDKQKLDIISAEDLEKISEQINKILDVKNGSDLKKVGDEIRLASEKYNESQLAFLREQYQKANNKFAETF